MKIAERVLLILALIGGALKLAHVPGGAILSILAITFLSLFYLIGSYFLLDPKKPVIVNNITYYKASALRVVIVLLSGYTFCTALIGILFRLMHWPGAAIMLLIGIISVLPIVVISVVKYLNQQENFFKQIAIRSGVMIILCTILFFCVLP